MANPYPDENSWWNDYTDRVNTCYGWPTTDDGRFKWFARPGHSIAAGLTAEVAAEKHLAELREALGVEAVRPTLSPAQPISIRDGAFWTADGQRWWWKFSTDFLLYKRFLDGEDIRPIIWDRLTCGANGFRVALMLHNIARFYPSDYGDRFWTELPKFNDLLTSWGCWWEATMFLDAQQVMPNPSQQLEHWARYGSTWITTPAEIPNPFTELVNEYPKNGVDPSRFNSFPWLICSRGSGLGDAPPYRPGWQYFGWHGRRDYPKVTSSTEDMWYVSQGGAWSNEVATYPPMIAVHDEPIGFAEQAQDGRRSSSPALAATLGAAAKELGQGGTFHSDDGIYSRLYSPRTRSCALAFFQGLSP